MSNPCNQCSQKQSCIKQAQSQQNAGNKKPANCLHIVPIAQSSQPATEDPNFKNFHAKLDLWLNKNAQECGVKEMDSIFFDDQQFELMVDTRGFACEDIRCTVGKDCVEVVAQRQDTSSPCSKKCLTTTRNYKLPKPVNPKDAICCLSPEGILLIKVCWER